MRHVSNPRRVESVSRLLTQSA